MHQDSRSPSAELLDGMFRGRSMARLAIVVVLLVVTAHGIAQLQTDNSEMVATVVRSVLVEETNQERVATARQGLRLNVRLQIAAQRKAEDMASKGYFAHTSPDGLTPWHWFDLVGYQFTHAGENLAVRFSDSDVLVRAWMASPTHRANVINGDFTETGIGIAKGVYKDAPTLFVVQLFGTPYRQQDERVASEDAFTQNAHQLSAIATEAQANSTSLFFRVLVSPKTVLMGIFLFLALGLVVLAMWSWRTDPTQWSLDRIRSLSALLLLCALCAYIVGTIIFPEVLIS